MKVIIKDVIIEASLIYKIKRNYYVANLFIVGGNIEAVLLCDESLVNGSQENYPDDAEMEIEFNKLLNFIEQHTSKSKLPYPKFI